MQLLADKISIAALQEMSKECLVYIEKNASLSIPVFVSGRATFVYVKNSSSYCS